MPQTFTRLRTPIGELVLTASDTALTGVFFPTSRRGPAPTHQAHWVEAREGPAADVLARARQQLEEYFARSRTNFDLPAQDFLPSLSQPEPRGAIDLRILAPF